MKFIRNHVSLSQRISIGLSAYHHSGIYGAITELAFENRVSRGFVYFCKSQLLMLLLQMELVCESVAISSTGLNLQEIVVCLYLEGESSVDGIQRMIWSLYGQSICAGRISEILNQYGRELAQYSITKALAQGLTLLVIDELFANGCPILVILDPCSLFVYEIRLVSKRDQDTWGESLERLVEEGDAIRVIADEAAAIRAAVGATCGTDSYGADHFHLLHPFKKLLLKLAKKAADTAKTTEKLREALEEAKGSALTKARKEHEEASQKEREASDIYNNYSYLFVSLCEHFRPVNTDTASLRTEEDATVQCQAALELMGEIDQDEVQKEAKGLIKKLPLALNYLKETPQVLGKLKKIVTDELSLQAFLMFYAYVKRLASAHKSQKEALKEQKNFWEKSLIEELGKSEFKRLWAQVEAELETLVRASSMVENLNSRLRRFLDTSRGQVNQERLNLIRFYFNHKVFSRGKRTGCSPIQLLHGQKERVSWIHALRDEVQRSPLALII